MLNKAQRHRQKGLLEPLYLPTRKWQSVSMDWIVKLPPVKAGGAEYDSCLIFTDRATKMVHLAPSNVKETAPQTAQLFMRYVVKYHGLPRSLQCDRDSKVTSAFWQELCNILDIRVRTTSSFHPQANGQAERTNQTVKQLLRIAASQGRNWLTAVDTVELSVNSAPISHTVYSPFFLNYGFEPCLFPDIYNLASPINSKVELTEVFVTRMQNEWKHIHHILQHVKDQSVEQTNKHRESHTIRPGDLVFVSMTPEQRKQLAKAGTLGQKFAGPYRVL